MKLRCSKCYKETDTLINRMCEVCNSQQSNIPYGWVCPRCGVVQAPFITECHCDPPTITESVTHPKTDFFTLSS